MNQGSFCPNRAVKPDTFLSGGVNPGHSLADEANRRERHDRWPPVIVTPSFVEALGIKPDVLPRRFDADTQNGGADGKRGRAILASMPIT